MIRDILLPMPRFSERVGAVKVEIQLGSMDERLKNSLWNLIGGLLPEASYDGGRLFRAVQWITAGVLKKPVDEIGHGYPAEARDWLRHQYKRMTWSEVYELVEFVVANAHALSDGRAIPRNLTPEVNGILEQEHAGYRVVGGLVTPITNPTEIAEIEAALVVGGAKFEGAHAHIAQALALFGKRPEPDYRNAIKEAISAVESAARVIAGRDKATLDDALKVLSGSHEIHGAMIDAFRRLYGYTSDEKGIRHSLLEDPANVVEEDARFMIVACSAFVNLLIVKADRAGLLR